MKVLNRTSPVTSAKCWRCGATTSGNICGICGSPLTRDGLTQVSESIRKPVREFDDRLFIISPKDRDLKQVAPSFEEIKETIEKYVRIKSAEIVPNVGPNIIIEEPKDPKKTFEEIRNEAILSENNIKILIRRETVGPGQQEIMIRFYYWESEPSKERWKFKNIALNLGLYVATFITVALAGWGFIRDTYAQFNIGSVGNMVLDIFLFTVSLMGILTIHELGHFFMSRRKNVDVTLPYFIPIPSIPGVLQTLGTFGAFIQQKEPIATRDDLFDIGFSGPIAGFLVALPVYITGLALTYVAETPADYTPPEIMATPTLLLDYFIQRIAFSTGLLPNVDPAQFTLIQHPVMFAGWIGFLLTGLNLMPATQLDGGHTSRAAFGAQTHRILTFIVALLLIINPSTSIFGLLILFMGMFRNHPGPIDDVSPITNSKYFIISAGYVLAVLCIPLPINQILGWFGAGPI
jgi:hypothetical protein